MIAGIPRTGFLIEDGAKLGAVIGHLRVQAIFTKDSSLRELAEYLDGIRAKSYYEPVSRAQEIQVEDAITPVAPAKPVEFVHLGLEVRK